MTIYKFRMSHTGISESIKSRKRSTNKSSTVYNISSDEEDIPVRTKPKRKLNRLSNVTPVVKKDDKQPVVVLEDIRK